MNRRSVLLGLAAAPWLARAQTPSLDSVTSAMSDPLLKSLTGQLGITEDQAKGGVGSYLTLLQEKLAKGDFDKIAGYVPGAAKYMDAAKSLGAVTGPLQNLAGLSGALGKLGISPEVASQFVPMLTNYLGKMGGSSVQQLLGGVLK
jgi:hypothetical protein